MNGPRGKWFLDRVIFRKVMRETADEAYRAERRQSRRTIEAVVIALGVVALLFMLLSLMSSMRH